MLKDKIIETIPSKIKTSKAGDYRLFLVYVKESKAKTVSELKKVLDSERNNTQKWLNNNKKTSKMGTKNHLLRAHAKHLDFLKRMNAFIKYL